jgi:hypothetical protein
LLEKLHAVGRLYRHQLELDPQRVGHVLGHVDFHADQVAAGIAEPPRLVVGLDADDDLAALQNLQEAFVGRIGATLDRCGNETERRDHGASDYCPEHLFLPVQAIPADLQSARRRRGFSLRRG